MTVEIKLPNLGENVSSGDVSTLLVNVGDRVEPNQDILEIETDKAVVPIPTNVGGVVTQIHVARGQTVSVGALLISLEASTAGAAPSSPAAPAAAAAPAPTAAPVQPAAPKPAAPPVAVAAQVTPVAAQAAPASAAPPHAVSPAPSAAATFAASAADDDDGSPSPAGPATRRLARELGVDIRLVTGSGPNGRITRDDVVAAVRNRAATASSSAAPSVSAPSTIGLVATPNGTDARDDWGLVRREPMAKIRKTIAAKMVESATTIPHVTNYDDADISELERIRKAGMSDYAGTQVKLTMMPFIMKAVAHALRLHPALNASLDMEKGEVHYKQYVNLGVAVDSDRGLVVPVIRAVDRLTIPQIASALTTTVEKVRNASFAVEDLRGGTFTISNLGAVGGTYSTPIINAPEVAILLIGRSRKMPVVIDDSVQVRLMMPLSLSYDHRLVDGAMAARFLNDVIGFLQNPGRLLLAP